MDCEVCFEELDLLERRPKALPCGHTTCLRCLHRLSDQRCPQCRSEIGVAVASLPDNYYVLGRIEKAESTGPSDRVAASRWWCVDCMVVASPACVDNHTVRNLKTALRRQLQELLPRAGRELQGLQEADADALRECGEQQLVDALELLSGPAGDCLLTVQRGSDGDTYTAHWSAGAAEDVLLKALVAALAVKGKLGKVRGSLRKEGIVSSASPSPAAQPDPPALSPIAQPPAGNGEACNDGAMGTGVQEPAIKSLGVKTMSLSPSNSILKPEKERLLERVRRQGVLRVACLFCHVDPDWTHQLLIDATPSLSRLNVWHPRPGHLALIHVMPHLERLDLINNLDHDALYGDSQEVSDLISVTRTLPQSLKNLNVKGDRGLPRDALVSLLIAHAATLETLELQVGTPAEVSNVLDAWPAQCNDLHTLLRGCQLGALQTLKLTRATNDETDNHSLQYCKRQLKKLRKFLPNVEVSCESIHCRS